MRLTTLALLTLTSLAAPAAELNLVAIMGNKVMVEIDGGRGKILAAGQSLGAVRLLSVNEDNATFEIGGKKQTLSMDNRRLRDGVGAGQARTLPRTLILPAQADGHFIADLSINGMPLRGVVDTGASVLALSSAHAKIIGLDLRNATPGRARTAQGIVETREIRLNTVKFGDVLLYNVEASVVEGNFPLNPLIGMNILERFSMQRDADRLTLIQRY